MGAPDVAGLADSVRLALRLTGHEFDEEVDTLASAALEDMLRVGVRPEFVAQGGPRVRLAASLFAKAHFGFDNPEAERFAASYSQLVIDMLNSQENGACS